MSLRRDVALKWNPKGALQVVDMAAGFFVFKFSEEEDMMKVITGGPWSIRALPLNLIHWRPNFQPLKEEISFAPVWIHLLGVSNEYWDRDILIQIASHFGKPLKIDECILNRERGR